MFADLAMPDCVSLYDRLAPRYDRLHRRWLKYAGGEAQAALESAVRAVIRLDMAMLDAGCGTGAFARRMIAEGIAPAGVTLLDPSEAMLAQAADLPATRVVARLERLPFADASFDVATCAWALETTKTPARAISELCRVVRPGGSLLLAFCADAPDEGLGAMLMRLAVEWRGSGRFLRRAVVEEAILGHGGFQLRWMPCHGPVAALLARRDVEEASFPGDARERVPAVG